MNQLTHDDSGVKHGAIDPDCSSTDSFFCPTLAHLFQHSAAMHPTRTALWIDGAAVSYQELRDLAAQVAGSLIAAGLADGSARCAILGNRGLIDFFGILGALFARCAYVPLNIRYPPATLARVMQQADASALGCCVADWQRWNPCSVSSLA